MNIERLRKIISYSNSNCEEIDSKVKRFCSFAGIEYDSELLNILQIVRSSFLKKGYLVFEIPFADEEIGALCYRGDGLGYVVLNTSLPRVNVNFAIAHEIYHVFFGTDEFVSKVEFVYVEATADAERRRLIHGDFIDEQKSNADLIVQCR